MIQDIPTILVAIIRKIIFTDDVKMIINSPSSEGAKKAMDLMCNNFISIGVCTSC